MLLTKTVKVKWNSKNKKHFVDLGYEFTKMGDEFEVNVHDLTHGSATPIEIMCDYCGRKVNLLWKTYMVHQKDLIKKDCCNNPKCTGKKAEETMMAKYGVKCCLFIPEFKKKQEETNLERYGHINPFGNKDIQGKIRLYNFEHYGGPTSTCSPEVIRKAKETNLRKYGVENFSQTKMFREQFRGPNSPTWKGGNRQTIRTERKEPEYRDWRKAVFIRDHFTCQICGAHNYKGRNKTVRLISHHLNCFKDFPEERMDIDNGITLCEPCHNHFHSLYGKRSTKEQFEDFLRQIKKYANLTRIENR